MEIFLLLGLVALAGVGLNLLKKNAESMHDGATSGSAFADHPEDTESLAYTSGRAVGRALTSISLTVDALDKRSQEFHSRAMEDLTQANSALGKDLLKREVFLGEMFKNAKRMEEIARKIGIIEALTIHDTTHKEHDELVPGWREAPNGFKSYRALSIPFLCHFTHVSNLPSILERGLLPVTQGRTLGGRRHINDKERLDSRMEATSTSVAFPNNRMLWKYRKENGMEDYVVLALDTSLIWRKTCAFCAHNAADRRIVDLRLEDLIGPDAFEKMFGYRNETSIPEDDQAEVLVFGAIEPRWIRGVFSLSDALGENFASKRNIGPVFFSRTESEPMFAPRQRGLTMASSSTMLSKFQSQVRDIDAEIGKKRPPITRTTFIYYLNASILAYL